MSISYGDAPLRMKATTAPPYDSDHFDGTAGSIAGHVSDRGRIWEGSASLDGLGNLVIGDNTANRRAYLPTEEHPSRLDLVLEGPGSSGGLSMFLLFRAAPVTYDKGVMVNIEDNAISWGSRIYAWNGSAYTALVANNTTQYPRKNRTTIVRVEDLGPDAGTDNIRVWIDTQLAVKASSSRNDGTGIVVAFWGGGGDTGTKVGAMAAWIGNVPYPLP